METHKQNPKQNPKQPSKATVITNAQLLQEKHKLELARKAHTDKVAADKSVNDYLAYVNSIPKVSTPKKVTTQQKIAFAIMVTVMMSILMVSLFVTTTLPSTIYQILGGITLIFAFRVGYFIRKTSK